MVLLAACQSSSTDKKAAPTPGPSASNGDGVTLRNLSTLTPYPTLSGREPQAPVGFEPVFATGVTRHGARTLTSEDELDDALALWKDAESQGALTETGKAFGPAVQELRTAMDDVGYGQLNTLGEQELRELGSREGERFSAMFEDAVAEGAKVDIIDSGESRAEDSAKMFSEGLGSVHPDLAIEPTESNKRMLHFDTEDKAYEDFLDSSEWKTAYHQVRRTSNIDQASIDALEKLYTPEFVATIDNTLYQGNAVFDMFRSGPSMSKDTDVDTSAFMDPEVAEVFATVDDGRYFYSRGPGVVGDDQAYRAASVLLDDFFTVIDDRLEGRGKHPHAAVYRFAHAEEITPFAALLEIPGAEEQLPPGEIFTRANNDFRVETIAQLASNIAWTVWGDGDTTLVSVTHNERPVPVGRDCRPFEDTTTFYELTELKSCLGDLR